jgi:redox-sensitive bicupin YhaK (pirin superfamily)
VQVNGREAIDGVALVTLSRDGDRIELQAEADSAVLLLSGKPLGEPVVGSGPFVMNTAEEIREAYRDYQTGKMGRLGA